MAPSNKSEKRQQSVSLPTDLYEWVKDRANRHFISMSAEINLLLSIAKERVEAEERLIQSQGDTSKGGPDRKSKPHYG